MRKFLVGSDIAYAAAKLTPTVVMSAVTPDLLADGSLGVYMMDATGTTLVVAPTTAAAGQITIANAIANGGGSPFSQAKYVIAVGTPTGMKVTDHFTRAEIGNGYSKEFEAAILHAIAQTITPVSVTPLISDTYILHINYLDEYMEYEVYDFTGVFATPTAFAAAAVIKINASRNTRVTASSAAGVLTLTSKEVGLAFATAWDIPAGAVAGAKTVTPMLVGNGVGSEVRKMEALFSTYDGFLQPYDGWLKRAGIRANAAAYDTYFIYLVKERRVNHQMDFVNHSEREIVIVTPDPIVAAGSDGFTTIFNALFNVDVTENNDAVAAT